MITAEGLLRLKDYAGWEYGEAETVIPVPPDTADALPAEWRAKLSAHRFSPPRVSVIHNATLAGINLAGFKGDDLVLPVGYYGRLDLWERNWPYFEFAMLARQIRPVEIECAFSMAGVWSGNYFHWLVDHLPTLEAYYAYEKRTGETPLILLASNPPAFVTESLDILGLKYRIDDHHHYRVERLVVPTWPRENGHARPGALCFLQSKYRQPHRMDGGRLYITRRNAVNRRVVNEEELPAGYIEAEMERLSFAEQTTLMANVNTLIGPHGAGLANLVLGHAPRVIEIATPMYSNPCIWLLAQALGYEYGLVMGEPCGKEDIRVDWQKVIDLDERV